MSDPVTAWIASYWATGLFVVAVVALCGLMIGAASLLVIFDIEAVYLFGWAVSVREVGWTGFVAAAVFILILLAGLVYDARVGALDWAPRKRGREDASRARELAAVPGVDRRAR